MKKSTIFVVLALVLTECGGGGSSSSEESFVSGDGSATYIRALIARLLLQLPE